MGTAYLLGVPEHGEARLHAAVKKVDDAMCRIRDAGKLKARDRIAVLAALNLAFELADRDTSSTAMRNGRLAGTTLPASSTAPLLAESPQQLAQLSALSQRLDSALAESEEAAPDVAPPSSDPMLDRTAYNG